MPPAAFSHRLVRQTVVCGQCLHSTASNVDIALRYEIKASYKPELRNCNRVLLGEGMYLDTKMGFVRAEILTYWGFETLILFKKDTGGLKVFWFMKLYHSTFIILYI